MSRLAADPHPMKHWSVTGWFDIYNKHKLQLHLNLSAAGHHTLIKAECILARAVHSIILTLLMSRYINHRMFIYIWKAERSSYSHRIFGLCGLF